MPLGTDASDLIVVFHAAYVSFVVFGLLAILVGALSPVEMGPQLLVPRDPFHGDRHRRPEALFGIPCPLTDWEQRLRISAGEASYSGDFIGYWAHQLIFYDAEPWVFTTIYILFGLAVAGA